MAPSMGDTPIHERIREVRERAGLKRGQCARAMGPGWDHSRWRRMELNERPPRAADMPRIAAVLGCTVAHLYGEQSAILELLRATNEAQDELG